MKLFLTIILSLTAAILFGQDTTRHIFTDKVSGCKIMQDANADGDSVSWRGACKNGFADGIGTYKLYDKGVQTVLYVGQMQRGLANGQGEYTFTRRGGGLKGNFLDGNYLDLDLAYLNQLHKNIVPIVDSLYFFVDRWYSKSLFYYALTPKGTIKGVLVLLPGGGELPEMVISSNKKLMQLAYDSGILTLVPSINNDYGVDDEKPALDFLNLVYVEAVTKYKAPKDKFILGGLSGGGMNALRYAEMAHDSTNRTSIIPAAVYGVDPPVDLAGLYYRSKRDIDRNIEHIGLSESKSIVEGFNQQYGGSPDQQPKRYIQSSMYSRSEINGGNAKYLMHVPVRLYCDPDIEWNLRERNRDYYDMNAADESAMINFLNLIGNKDAEFISALGKGYRLDGTRHPHSWSIVDPDDCIRWILNNIK